MTASDNTQRPGTVVGSMPPMSQGHYLFGLHVSFGSNAVNSRLFQIESGASFEEISSLVGKPLYFLGFTKAVASKDICCLSEIRTRSKVYNLRNPLGKQAFYDDCSRLQARGVTVSFVSLHAF